MINGYDFDETIYDGDSSVNFYLFCLKKNKKVLKQLPTQIKGLIKYKTKKIEKTEFKEYVFSFLKHIDNVDQYVEEFCKENYKKIKSWYFDQQEKTDVIISASPEFLLKPLEKQLKVKIIGSKVDKKTGKFDGKNCHDYEKIVRYEKEMKKKNNIKRFYSDSIKADGPMFEYAEEAFLVKGNNITKINIKDYEKKK